MLFNAFGRFRRAGGEAATAKLVEPTRPLDRVLPDPILCLDLLYRLERCFSRPRARRDLLVLFVASCFPPGPDGGG